MRTPVIDLFRPFLWLFARAYFGIRLEGRHHVPLQGPLIIASNHVSYADPVFVCVAIRRPVHYLAWSRLFEVPGFGWLIRRLRAFPVETESADPRAARKAVRLLRAGAALMVFPEGGRTQDGRLQPFKLGAFRLACSLHVPVLPVTILGGHEAWPPHRRFPRPGRITVVYHPLLTTQRSGDLRTASQELARQARAAIVSQLPFHQRPVEAEAG
ncbi:MAG: lysophospholipid acyltransferase family protein [Candidatus Methylomirabilia bacterium]